MGVLRAGEGEGGGGGEEERGGTYGGCMSVNAVLDELLDDRGQAVADDLAGLDLVDLGEVSMGCSGGV